MSTLGNRRRLAQSVSRQSMPGFAGKALLDLLDRYDAIARVGIILEKYLEIDTDYHRPLIRIFNQHLFSNIQGGLYPDFFWDRQSQQDSDASLEAYLVDEFVGCTNYQEYLNGQARNLVLLGKAE